MAKKVKMTKEQKQAYKETNEYKYKHNRNVSYIFYATSWMSALLPDAILLGVNRSKWVTTNQDTVKVSMGLVLTILVTIFISYKKLKSEVKFNYLSICIGAWVVFGIVYLLSSLLTQMMMILLCAAIGLTISLGLEIPAEIYKSKKELYRDENIKENTFVKAVKKVAGINENQPTE